MMEPTKAPWIHPGVVVHEPKAAVDHLLGDFALAMRDRGFAVAGFVRSQGSNDLYDIGTDQSIPFEPLPGGAEAAGMAVAARSLRKAMRDDADLVVLSGFPAFENAAKDVQATVEQGLSHGMPVLTSIPACNMQRWHDFVGKGGAMMAPDPKALWRWWGPERLYRDLALGVANDEVRQLVCGPRWIMIEGPAGAGLAYFPRNPKELLPRLPRFRRMGLRQLAHLVQSWDPLEMSLGIAAINAHYNRRDLDADPGDGLSRLTNASGRVVVIGAVPGLRELVPNLQVIEADPKPGDYPMMAMDDLLPGAQAAVITSSTLINRTLPRILRLSGGRATMIGPSTPLTPRLHDYGAEILGGLIVTNPSGLAQAVRDGAAPRDFTQFGRYVHLASPAAMARPQRPALRLVGSRS